MLARAFLSSLMLAPIWVVHADEPVRHAILVGINKYKHPRLPDIRFAEADVLEFADPLRHNGYQITLMTGSSDISSLVPTKANIENRVDEILKSCNKGDLVLVAFAGHGLQFEGTGDAYFCPVDARPFSDETETLVSLKGVYNSLDKSFAGMKVLLVDACRNNPEFEAGRGARSGMTADGSIRPPMGVAALFSCSAGEKAYEHESIGHGIFFHAVLEGFEEDALGPSGEVSFTRLAAHVKESVPGRVSSLFGGATKQSPNLRADYSNEPSLASPRFTVHRTYISYCGSHEVNFELGWLSRFGKEEEVKEWLTEAEAGCSRAQFLAARAYDLGWHVDENSRKAVDLYRRAAAQNEPMSTLYLGWRHLAGGDVPKDQVEAIRLFQKSAKAGVGSAMMALGEYYENAEGAEKDLDKAIEWYKAAAEKGSRAAQAAVERLDKD